MAEQVKVIIITGTMGAGKTTVLAEASDILAAQSVIHAAIDLDSLGVAHLPEGLALDIPYRNLASVWFNYRAAGVRRLLIAEAVESKAVPDRIRQAIPGLRLSVVEVFVHRKAKHA